MTYYDWFLVLYAYIVVMFIVLWALCANETKRNTIEYMDEFDENNHMTARGCFLIQQRLKNSSQREE